MTQPCSPQPDYTVPDEGEAAAELEYVIEALEEAKLLVAGLDQVMATIYLLRKPTQWLPLRTKLAQAGTKAEAVLRHLHAKHRQAPAEAPGSHQQ